MNSTSVDLFGSVAFVALLALLIVLVIWLRQAVRIVPENQRLVVFRLGRCIGSRGPGLVILIPVIDMAARVDLLKTVRVKVANLPTLDHRQFSCSVALEGKVIDPEKSVLNVPDLNKALSGTMETQLKEIAVSKNSAELVERRSWLEDQLTDALNRSGRLWGFAVSRVAVEDLQAS